MKKTILITGGAGFIGSSLAEKLASDKNARIIIIDNLLTGSLNKVPTSEYDNVTFIKGDVNKLPELAHAFTEYKPNHVFHFAAVVGVKRTLENPLMVLNDLEGIRNVLQLSKKSGVERVLYSSSSEVYGEATSEEQHEERTPLNSRLPYAVVKNACEAFLRAYHREFNLNYTIFRFFNTYGPKQSKDFVISRFIASALKGEDITIYGDGGQSRTFCYIDDSIEACVNEFKKGKFINDVINIGNDKETKITELAELILRLTGSVSKIVHFPPLPEGDMKRRRPDITRMRTLFERELTPLEEGIQKILENPKFIL